MSLRDTATTAPAHHPPADAVCVDLRRTPGADAVADALDAARYDDGGPRFVVVDDAARLVAHQLLYERLHAHGPARIVCLAVGSSRERVLSRPLTLRPPAAGVLWLLDPHTGDDPDGLRPLVELLAQRDVFDAVLTQLGDVVHNVAVPSVRVVEHDLTDEARTRAWQEALTALTGQDAPGGAVPGDTVPPDLALLLDDSLPEAVAGHRWLDPSRPAAARRRACDDASEDAHDGYRLARGPAGLFTARARRADLPARLAALGRALEAYRDTVAGAFTDADGVRLTADRRARLLERGIVLPDLPAASRARVVPALRELTERLLDRRLPLRSAAARLAALADRSAPAGSAARLARLDEVCDPAYLRHLAAPPPFRAGGAPAAAALLALVPAFLAGLWAGPGWVLGPVVGLAAAALGLLMRRHRPDRSPDGRRGGPATTQVAARLLGGLTGGAAGAVAGAALALPLWAGAPAAALAVIGVVVLALRDWTASVDAWWRATDAAYAARVLTGVDRLLAETAVHDWLLADARHHCSDGARAAGLLLRGLAATADAHGRGDAPAPAAPLTGALAEPRPVPEPGTGTAGRSAVPAGPDGTTDAWDWDTWGDSSADDGWYGAEPAAPTGPAHHGPPAADPATSDTGAAAYRAVDAFPAAAPPQGPAYETVAPAQGPAYETVPPVQGPAYEAVPRHAGGDADEDARWSPWQPAGPAEDPPWLERERGDGGPDLVGTLVDDLAAGTRRILTPCWTRIERDPARAGRTPLDGPMREVLDEVHDRLVRDAATSPPPYAPRSGERPDAARLTGVAPDRVAELLAAGDAEATVPLCGPQHRRLLSADPLEVRRVRFVPEAFRRGAGDDDEHRPAGPRAGHAGDDGFAEDVVWTPTGRHAGVLGLVPLRADAVRTVREETPDEEADAS
ncbi:hypothetical protein [Streptomyces sp. DH12]|uniref:hypothetical protein n=1 Tax=Streptomyces sp. DH12 TaxID=2857010 RepID=UPI001E47ED8A|nr:hypothetical protein [Streptomyces sp. DH12]